MSGTGFTDDDALMSDLAAWTTPVQPGVPDTRQVPAEPTDAQMLDWLMRNDLIRIQGNDTRGWAALDCRDGLVLLTRGHPTFRAAIAAAMKEHP